MMKLEVTKEDVPALVKGLENSNTVLVRANAAAALEKLGAEAGTAVPALTAALKDKEIAVRIRAARALGKIGPQAGAAVPFLAAILVEKLPDGPGRTSLRTGTIAGLSPEAIYQRTLKSSAWILVRTPGGLATGSGSLIHLPHRLVLTNYHVVGSADAVRVFFPHYDNSELITKPSYYVDKESKLGLTGTVKARDATRDLALLALDRLPPGVLALPLAAKSPLPNQNLFSVGASGAFDGVLWRSTTGQVRQVYYNDKIVYNSGQQVRARVVETQSPINAGDSGGPIVNERGEQVAVVNANRRGEQLLSYGIDITEVRAFLKEASQTHGLNLDNATNSARESLGGTASELRECAVTALGLIGADAEAAIPVLREALRSKDGPVRTSAIVALGDIGPKAKSALVDLAVELSNPDSRDQVVEALAKIGKTPDGVDVLINQLYKRDKEIRIGVSQALGRIGPPAHKAVIRLNEVVKSDKDPRVRQAAREAQHRVQAKP